MTFFPTHLNTYEQCPERYFLEFVEEHPKPEDFFVPSLERGSAIHKVLSEVALVFQETGRLPTDIYERASKALKREKYSSDKGWEEDLQIVIRDVEFGLGLFDRTVEILAVETKYYREFPETIDEPRFVLAARVDLVLHRCDEDGLFIIDVVDFKSGKGSSSPLQEYACHTVVEQYGPRFRVPYNYVRNTIVCTGLGEAVSFTIDEGEREYQAQHIRNLIKAILVDRFWQPNASPLCDSCPYQKDGCSLALNRNGADALDSVER